MNWSIATTLIIAAVGGVCNLVWMATTLRIENRIGAKIDSLKDWMEGRYVSIATFQGHQSVVALQHLELARRLTKIELGS